MRISGTTEALCRVVISSVLLAVSSLAGCAENTAQPNEGTSNHLGIAEFEVVEAPALTTIIGLGADGSEVGRMELVHGRFTLTGSFTSDYNTPEVDGRSLTVDVRGQTLNWQTATFEPVLHLPAHPPSQWALAEFLDDPHVKPVLDRWGIGFEPSTVGRSEVAFGGGDMYGTNPQSCGSTLCGTSPQTLETINMCNGGTAYNGVRVEQVSYGLGGWSSYDQVLVAQCCQPKSGILGGNTDWFALKSCWTNTTNTTTQCGPASSGACKGCPEYPAASSPTCSTSTNGGAGSWHYSSLMGWVWLTRASYTYAEPSDPPPAECVPLYGTCNSSAECCDGATCNGGAGGFCDL